MSVEIVIAALPFASVMGPSELFVVESRIVTVPVAAAGVIVMVSATGCPNAAGFGDADSVTAVVPAVLITSVKAEEVLDPLFESPL